MTLIEKIGRALWGEQWQSQMARELPARKDTIQDWRQSRAQPKVGVYRDLRAILSRRRTEIDDLTASLDRMIVEMDVPSKRN